MPSLSIDWCGRFPSHFIRNGRFHYQPHSPLPRQPQTRPGKWRGVQRLVQSHLRKAAIRATKIGPIWSAAVPTHNLAARPKIRSLIKFVVIPAPKFPRKLRQTGLAWQKVSGEMADTALCHANRKPGQVSGAARAYTERSRSKTGHSTQELRRPVQSKRSSFDLKPTLAVTSVLTVPPGKLQPKTTDKLGKVARWDACYSHHEDLPKTGRVEFSIG